MNNLINRPSLDQPVKRRKSPVRRSVFEIGTYNHNSLRKSTYGKNEFRSDAVAAARERRAAGVACFATDVIENKASSFLAWREAKPFAPRQKTTPFYA